jgi:hypothetical protein
MRPLVYRPGIHSHSILSGHPKNIINIDVLYSIGPDSNSCISYILAGSEGEGHDPPNVAPSPFYSTGSRLPLPS